MTDGDDVPNPTENTEPAPYSVTWAKDAGKALRRLPRNLREVILADVETLAADPTGALLDVKPLINERSAYRLRVGQFRILFDRDDAARRLSIVDVKPRGSAYHA